MDVGALGWEHMNILFQVPLLITRHINPDPEFALLSLLDLRYSLSWSSLGCDSNSLFDPHQAFFPVDPES